ncbi:hypothetical protein AVEN_171937-1 [Araneus ventricosus]|uniref:Uncharacterized protein n=1 Tax=Araneus ventricosus TaxID=182803 RepID=A0A4Y2RT24_ARAVE|nr:hypothetical protein AVEN_171937-1 [Araneus ventricosus]
MSVLSILVESELQNGVILPHLSSRVKLNDSRCNSSTTKAGVITAISGHSPIPPEGENEFGHARNVCVRLRFLKDVTPASKNEKFLSVFRAQFPDKDVQAFNLCGSCKRSPYNSKIPPLSRNIGFIHPDGPDLPSLDPISERLISPRLPFIQI